MAASLVPCPSCARHVRSTEGACPFCRSAFSSNLAARAVPGTTQRLSRAAAFTFAASLAATGCASDPVPVDAATSTDVGTDSGTVTDRGSATDVQTQPDVPAVTDNGLADDGGNMALYGGPPVDAGAQTDSGSEPDDGGGVAPLYGLPPPDAGQDGSIGVRYGAPPRPDAAV